MFFSLIGINIPRNRYINEVLSYYNKDQKRRFLEQRLKIESEMAGEDSMKTLKEFENLA